MVFIAGMLFGLVFELSVNALHERILGKPFKIHHRFHFSQKVGLFSLPLWGIVAELVSNFSMNILTFFIVSAVVGTVAEYLLGRFIRSVFGVKLWTYKYGNLGPYTSIYSLPLWGAGGLFFLYLASFVGILTK